MKIDSQLFLTFTFSFIVLKMDERDKLKSVSSVTLPSLWKHILYSGSQI